MFLDTLIFGIRKLFLAGVEQPVTTGIDLAGYGWSLNQALDGEGLRRTEIRFAPSLANTTDGSLVASRLNEAVAASATSADNDVPIPASSTQWYQIEVNMEGSAGARTTASSRAVVVRSGSNTPTLQSTIPDIIPSGLALNITISSNNLRVNSTKSAGTSARIDTRIWLLRSVPTVEFS